MLINSTNHKLPSNRKFGFFFAVLFTATAIYFFINNIFLWYLSFGLLSIVFLIISILLPSFLSPLNKLWFKFGMLLGKIISPIILGIIFVTLIIPTGIIIRLMGRDELRLKRKIVKSFWIRRLDENSQQNSFKNQF